MRKVDQERSALLVQICAGRAVSIWLISPADEAREWKQIALDIFESGAAPPRLGAVFAELAQTHPEHWLVWREVSSADVPPFTWAALAPLVSKPRHRNELLHQGLTHAEYASVRSLGYVEHDDAALIHGVNARPTWLISPRLGVVHSSVFGAVPWGFADRDQSKTVADLIAWTDFGRRITRAGVLCLSDPGLPSMVDGELRTAVDVPLQTAGRTSHHASANDLAPMIERCYGVRWVLFWCFARVLFGPSRLSAAKGLMLNFLRWMRMPASERKRFGGDVPAPLTFASHQQRLQSEAEDSDRVTVVIPTFGREPALRALLAELQLQESPVAEVVVVEQCPEGIAPYAIDWTSVSDLRIRHQRVAWVGAGRARNVAMRGVSSGWILFLDDDVGTPSDFVSGLVNEAKRWNAGALSAAVVSPAGGTHLKRAFNERDIDAEIASAPVMRQRKQRGDLTWASSSFAGCATLVRADAVTAINGFDERLDLGYGEDYELGIRLRLAGYPVLTTNRVALVHYHAPIGGFRALQGLDWDGEIEPKPSPYVLLSRSGLEPEMQRAFLLVYALRQLGEYRWRALWRWVGLWRRVRSARRWRDRFRSKERGGIPGNG